MLSLSKMFAKLLTNQFERSSAILRHAICNLLTLKEKDAEIARIVIPGLACPNSVTYPANARALLPGDHTLVFTLAPTAD